MKSVLRVALAIGASCFLAAGVWALPQKATLRVDRTAIQDAAEVQSASGKITSVESNSFNLEITPSAAPAGRQFSQDNNQQPKTMIFVIDKNTAVDGKLAVGSSADVTYRQDNGNNIAVSVRVAPRS